MKFNCRAKVKVSQIKFMCVLLLTAFALSFDNSTAQGKPEVIKYNYQGKAEYTTIFDAKISEEVVSTNPEFLELNAESKLSVESLKKSSSIRYNGALFLENRIYDALGNLKLDFSGVETSGNEETRFLGKLFFKPSGEIITEIESYLVNRSEYARTENDKNTFNEFLSRRWTPTRFFNPYFVDLSRKKSLDLSIVVLASHPFCIVYSRCETKVSANYLGFFENRFVFDIRVFGTEQYQKIGDELNGVKYFFKPSVGNGKIEFDEDGKMIYFQVYSEINISQIYYSFKGRQSFVAQTKYSRMISHTTKLK